MQEILEQQQKQDEESNTHVVMPSEENVEEEMSDEKMHVVMPAVMDQDDIVVDNHEESMVEDKVIEEEQPRYEVELADENEKEDEVDNETKKEEESVVEKEPEQEIDEEEKVEDEVDKARNDLDEEIKESELMENEMKEDNGTVEEMEKEEQLEIEEDNARSDLDDVTEDAKNYNESDEENDDEADEENDDEADKENDNEAKEENDDEADEENDDEADEDNDDEFEENNDKSENEENKEVEAVVEPAERYNDDEDEMEMNKDDKDVEEDQQEESVEVEAPVTSETTIEARSDIVAEIMGKAVPLIVEGLQTLPMFHPDEFVIDPDKEYDDNVAVESEQVTIVDTGKWQIVEEKSNEVVEEVIPEEDAKVAVPASSALFLCSFLGTMDVLPSFCQNAVAARSAENERPGLTNVCDYYTTRGYRPFFCNSVSKVSRTNDSDEQKARHDGHDHDAKVETVLEQFLSGGGLAPFLQKSLVERIDVNDISADPLVEQHDDNQEDTEVTSTENPEEDNENENQDESTDVKGKQSRPSFGKLVGTTIAAGAGLALLNNYVKRPRPQYQTGYYGQQSYRPSAYPSYGNGNGYGYPTSSFFPFAREQVELFEREDKLRENTFGKLVAGGIGLATAYHLTNHLFNRPSYSSSSNYYNRLGRPGYSSYSGYSPYHTGYGGTSFGLGFGRSVDEAPKFENCNGGKCQLNEKQEAFVDELCGPYMYFEYEGSYYFICHDDSVHAIKAEDIPSKHKRSSDDADEPQVEQMKDVEMKDMEMNMEITKQMDVPMVDVIPADKEGEQSNTFTVMQQLAEQNEDVEEESTAFTPRKKPLTNFVGAGLGLAAGYYLANKFASGGQNNYPLGGFSYNQYPERPGLFHLPYSRPTSSYAPYYGFSREDEVNGNGIEVGVVDEHGRQFPVDKESTKDGITEIGIVGPYGRSYPFAIPGQEDLVFIPDTQEDGLYELGTLDNEGNEVAISESGLPENIVEVGIVDEEGRQIPTHLELRDGDDEKTTNTAATTSSSKPNKATSLLVGGLGLAAGYYLANKFSQNRPQYNQGGYIPGGQGTPYPPQQNQQYNQGGYIPGASYPPQQHQQYNQGGYNSLPGGHGTPYPPQQSYNPYQQQYYGNNFGSSGSSFGSSGNSFGSSGSSFGSSGSSFGSRPSYSTSSFSSSPSFGSSYSGGNSFGSSFPSQYGGYPYSRTVTFADLYPQLTYRPAKFQPSGRTFAITDVQESDQVKKVEQFGYELGCIPVLHQYVGNKPFYRCKNNRFPATLIQDLKPVKTSYGWRIPYLSYGTGNSVTAFVPVGSYDPDDYKYSQLLNVNNSTGLQYFIEG